MGTGKASFATVAFVLLSLLVSGVLSYWITNASTDPLGLPQILVPLGLFGLLVALAIAVPMKVSNLNALPSSEGEMIRLEWLKAYVGRLLGPLFAFAMQATLGYGPLLGVLCALTLFVAVTA